MSARAAFSLIVARLPARSPAAADSVTSASVAAPLPCAVVVAAPSVIAASAAQAAAMVRLNFIGLLSRRDHVLVMGWTLNDIGIRRGRPRLFAGARVPTSGTPGNCAARIAALLAVG